MARVRKDVIADHVDYQIRVAIGEDLWTTTVRGYSTTKFSDLADVMIKQLGLRDKTLYFYTEFKPILLDHESAFELLMAGTVPVFCKTVDSWRQSPPSLRPQSIRDGLRIFVADASSGRTVTIDAAREMRIRDLKDIIGAELGVFPELQRLICGGKQLGASAFDEGADEKTLQDYDITSGATIQNVLRLTGGREGLVDPVGEFVDVSQGSALVRRSFAKKAPDWRRVEGGMWLEGICATQHCPAAQQMVCCKMGYGDFDLFKVAPKCPMCQGIVKATKPGFMKCIWCIDGVGEDGTRVMRPWRKVAEGYETYDEVKAGKVVYQILNFRVKRLEDEVAPGIVQPFCTICKQSIGREKPCKVTRCKHAFHEECLAKSWHQHGCPNCDVRVL